MLTRKPNAMLRKIHLSIATVPDRLKLTEHLPELAALLRVKVQQLDLALLV